MTELSLNDKILDIINRNTEEYSHKDSLSGCEYCHDEVDTDKTAKEIEQLILERELGLLDEIYELMDSDNPKKHIRDIWSETTSQLNSVNNKS